MRMRMPNTDVDNCDMKYLQQNDFSGYNYFGGKNDNNMQCQIRGLSPFIGIFILYVFCIVENTKLKQKRHDS